MLKRILVPLDGSRLSERAVPLAVEIVKRFGAELIFLRVVTPAPIASGMAAGSTITWGKAQRLTEDARRSDRGKVAQAKRYLIGKRHGISETGVDAATVVVIGQPAPSILATCRKSGVDLVVMTTHGRGGLKRAILGSVADELVRSPIVNVLVVRPAKHDR